MIEDVLVIGYGNALRTDDGLGWHAAERLAADPRAAGATILRRHQLTPELALDLSRAAFAIFVDAGNGPPGSLTVEPVRAAGDAGPGWSHHVDPGALLALARELYGRCPEAVAVSVGLASDGAGEHLSPPIAALLPTVVEEVLRLMVGRAAGADTTGLRARSRMSSGVAGTVADA